MIVRILGEGRYELGEDLASDLEKLDAALVTAMDADDEDAFAKTLDSIISEVRTKGSRVAPDDVRTSSRVVPHPGSTIAEVKELLAEEG